jgi:hypothetical protein
MSSNHPVRVLLLQDPVTSNNWGGVQTMTQTLQLALQEQGFEVTALPWQQTKFVSYFMKRGTAMFWWPLIILVRLIVALRSKL